MFSLYNYILKIATKIVRQISTFVLLHIFNIYENTKTKGGFYARD